MAKPTLQTVFHQPSYRLATRDVEAFVTRTAGMVAPVNFRLGDRTIQPYYIAPWAAEPVDESIPPLLEALRGDFFCMPFGGSDVVYKNEDHPPHGQTANEKWALESLDEDDDHTTLRLSMQTTIRPGRVDKTIRLRPGHTAVYSRHTLTGYAGPMSLGHHATLRFPDEPGCGLISTSRFVHGQVIPAEFESPAAGGYTSLKRGATFKKLDNVPAADGSKADLSRYPARRGFEDLVQMINHPDDELGWTAVAFPKQRFVWFALKDPRTLTGTALWHSNGGRHYAPWNGRNVNTLGLEEATSYFCLGLGESARKNALSEKGYATTLKLSKRKPTVINYVTAVAAIPEGFDHVKQIKPNKQGVTLTSRSGKKVAAAVDVDWLWGR